MQAAGWFPTDVAHFWRALLGGKLLAPRQRPR
jgi:hypothetical protein